MRRPGSAARASAVLLSFTFAVTGVSIASYGAMLPLLFRLWHMNYAGAGVLLFAFFAGSSAGGLLARGNLRYVFTGTCLLASAATALLGTAPYLPPLLLTAAYGLGLGGCMTSVSLQQARANPAARTSELARLNMIWALGALAGPWLCLRVGLRFTPHTVFQGSAAVFLAVVLCAVLLPGDVWIAAPARFHVVRRGLLLQKIWPLLLVIPISTGLESAAGGWLTTYASRAGAHRWAQVALPSVFWAGLLLCRLLYSSRRAFSVERSFRVLPWVAVAGLLLLCVAPGMVVLCVGAALLGWGIGSLYPMALAFLLETTELGNVGFLIAGIGSASVPMATGLVADAFHSLRVGMVFLLLPAVVLAWAATYHLRRSRTHGTLT